jgi:purine-cytosine permease-like protein
VVHAAVVLVPLAAIGVLLTAFWPAARARLGVAVVVIAALGTLFAYLAVESGGYLEDQVAETEQVEEHAKLGDSGLASAVAVLLGAVAVTGFGVYEKRRSAPEAGDGTRSTRKVLYLRIGVGVVAVVLVSLGTLQIARIGHSGAKATWEDVGGTGVDIDDD